jgi:hypothetical protein
MTQQKDQGGGFAAMLGMMEHIAKMPAPADVLKELKRFNDTMERLQPDLSKMANAIQGVDMKDVRSLNTTLQNLETAKILCTIQDANNTVKLLYEKLWGRK